MRRTIVIIGFVIAVTGGACKKSAQPLSGSSTNTTLQTIQQDNQLIILNAALIRSGLDTVLAGGGPYTIFAPTDDAFVAAGWPLSRILATDPDSLRSIIGYSIVEGRVSNVDLVGFLSQKFTSLNPDYDPQITKDYYGIFLNGNFVTTQILRGDGVVNKIDGFALPPAGNLYQAIMTMPNLTICADILSKNLVLTFYYNPATGTEDTLYLNGLLQYPADNLFTYGGRNPVTIKNVTLFLPSDSAFLASGYSMQTIDSIAIANNAIVGPQNYLTKLVGYWAVQNEYFTSDFLYTGFLVGVGTFYYGGYQPTTNTAFISPSTYQGDLGIRPDGRTLYSFQYTSTVGDTYAQSAFTVGHITQPNIAATNGVIHIVDSVFHF